jgi:hypothetical protein
MAVNNLNTPGVGIQPSIVDAKGDLLVGTAADAISRLGVTGTTGAVLTADAGETTGLKWAAAGSVGGLVHINTTTFSAVASQSINDVFSASYKNYKIIWTGVTSTTAGLDLRLRVGGTDNSTASSYVRQGLQVTGTSVIAARNSLSAAVMGDVTSTLKNAFSVEIYDPFLAEATGMYSLCLDATSGAVLRLNSVTHNQTVSYTGFTVLTSTGNMTGSISTFGYKD